MNVNFRQALKTLSGDEIKEGDAPVTLGAIAINALLAAYPSEQPTGDEKVQRWRLAQKIFAAGESLDIRSEDVVLIKRLVGIAYAPLIVGQAFDMLEYGSTARISSPYQSV